MSMRTSLEEGIKLHRLARIFPEQFLTVAGRHREAVVAADQRMVIRYFRDDLAGFVHDVSHVAASNPTRRYRPGIGSSDAPEQWHVGRTAQAVCNPRPTDRGHALHYAVRFRYSIVSPGLHAVAKMEIRT